jgi:hypothetical protein
MSSSGKKENHEAQDDRVRLDTKVIPTRDHGPLGWFTNTAAEETENRAPFNSIRVGSKVDPLA